MITSDYVFGILGNITAILIFTSPISQFREIVKRKSAENYNATPYVTMLLSCSLWILYGVFNSDDGVIIITVNTAGLTLQVLYLTLFFIYSSQEERVKYFGFVVLDLIFYGIIVAITLVVFEQGSRHTFLGVLCATLNVIMYAAPLAALRSTIKTQSIEYMPILLVFCLFVNGCIWVTFALLVRDFYVLVPSVLGIILATIQMCLYLKYKNLTLSSKSADMVKELEEGSIGMQMNSKYVNTQEKINNESSQKRAFTRQDAFPIVRSPSLSPERSNPQQLENDSVDP